MFIPNGADGRIRTCDELSLRVYKTRALGQLCDISIMGCGRKLRVKDPQPQHLVLACLLQAQAPIIASAKAERSPAWLIGADDEIRTRDILLGRQSLYQSTTPACISGRIRTCNQQFWRLLLYQLSYTYKKMEEGVGFEPTVRFRTPVFKTGAINHSASLPKRVLHEGSG